MKKRILMLHGPNLNLLGTREPTKYGNQNSESIFNSLKELHSDIELLYLQSNHEGELVDIIQDADKKFDGILLNPGAYAHSSIAIADAIRSVSIPCMCVHITYTLQREEFRHTDLVADACVGAVIGLGVDGYQLALESLLEDYLSI